MKLSLKNMLISFVIALVILSVIMTVVCVSIYRSKISAAVSGSEGDVTHTIPSYQSRFDLNKIDLWYDGSDDFHFAVLVGISETEKRITITSISADLPINYKNGIYFVSSVLSLEGTTELVTIAEVITGITAKNCFYADKVGVGGNGDVADFTSQIEQMYADRYEGYTCERIEILLDENGVADNHKTREQFFIIESK